MKQFGTEARPGQLMFFNNALSTLRDGGVLLAEAPPGVGKTLAYLNAAVEHGEFPILIAVHRRALQDQIIADCAKHFPGLKAVVIKGHNAYGCGLNLPAWAQGELPKDCPQEDREKVSSAKCLKVGDCYAKRAKVAAFSADIVICTHTMLCVDQRVRNITKGAAAVLPDVRALIIDEAHCLYWEAVNMMSYKISPSSFLKNEEAPCIEWLKKFRTRVFGEAPEDVDWVIEAVEAREHYQLYETTKRENEGEDDLASKRLIERFGEASFRQIAKNHSRAEHLIESLKMIGDEDYVSWSEEGGIIEVKPKESSSLTAGLFKKRSTVACSATLPFKMFRQEHQITEAQEITVPSSFDPKKVRVVIKGPHPTKMKFRHQQLVKDSLIRLQQLHGGNILVLCASYAMAGFARDALANAQRVVMQEPGQPLPDFPEDGILIACESAWAGFDRKGLKAVVITSVPYLVPDPWVNSMLEAKGWPWYNTQARTKLIQGIGRLQRSADDEGLVLILDDRAKRLVKAS